VWWSHGFPGWEMSAICTRKLNSLDRSDPSSWEDLYNASYNDQSHDYSIRWMGVAYASCPDRISFSCFIWSKWVDMSVANTMSTIILRTWEYCSEVKPLSTSESSCEGGEGGSECTPLTDKDALTHLSHGLESVIEMMIFQNWPVIVQHGVLWSAKEIFQQYSIMCHYTTGVTDDKN
jgi:hypothetical protein